MDINTFFYEILGYASLLGLGLGIGFALIGLGISTLISIFKKL